MEIYSYSNQKLGVKAWKDVTHELTTFLQNKPENHDGLLYPGYTLLAIGQLMLVQCHRRKLDSTVCMFVFMKHKTFSTIVCHFWSYFEGSFCTSLV